MRYRSDRCSPLNPGAVAAIKARDALAQVLIEGPLELSHLFAQQARLAFQFRSPLANLVLHFRRGLRLEFRIVQPGQMLAVMRSDFVKLLPDNRERFCEIEPGG